jgi:hypothetical protein
MRIGLLTAYHLGEEITIQGHSSNGKEFTLTGTLLDVEHSFEDDTEYVFAEFVDSGGAVDIHDAAGEDLEDESSADNEDEDLDDDCVRSLRLTEISLCLSESTEITIELPADHEVTVESAEHDDEDDADIED